MQQAVEVVVMFDGAVVDVKHLRGNGAFTIGLSEGASFPVWGEGKFELVKVEGEEVRVCSPMSRGRESVALHDGTITIDVGMVSFTVRRVWLPDRLAVPDAVEWGAHVYTGGTAAAWVVMLVLAELMPPQPQMLALDRLGIERVIKVNSIPRVEPPMPVGPRGSGMPAPRAKGPEGTAGTPTSTKRGRMTIKGEDAYERALKSGPLAVLRDMQSAEVASIFGREGGALGIDAQTALGSLAGTEPGDGYGNGGLSVAGSGRGGGGEGTIGLGSVGTIGKGGRGGDRSGYGRSAGGLRGHRPQAPDAVPGQARVVGALDKEIIRRVIRRHLNEIRYCYEKQLLRDPSLYGRIAVDFTIGPTGRVLSSSVGQSTISNAELTSCVVEAVRRWEFPQPQGGGVVSVHYPFVVKAAGDN